MMENRLPYRTAQDASDLLMAYSVTHKTSICGMPMSTILNERLALPLNTEVLVQLNQS